MFGTCMSDDDHSYGKPSNVFPFATVQPVGTINSSLVHARKLMLSIHVHETTYTIYEYWHA